MEELGNNRLGRQLQLLLLMIDGRQHTVTELCDVLGTSARNLYYFFDQLREDGFLLKRKNGCYLLDTRSPFFQQIATSVNFSDDEAAYLYKLVDAVKPKTNYAEAVINKLCRFYDIDFVTDKKLQSKTVENVSRLYDAMNRKRVVILCDYSSSHSRTVSNRFVEPFLFLNEQNDIRCYELASHTNKTFKLSRIGEVRIVEELMWSHEYMHKNVYTDLFMFSGENYYHVKLRLGQLARNLLLEEYPRATRMVRQDDERHWLLETDVVSYVGIGRFVLGLAEDIEVLEDEGLRHYLREKVEHMKI